MSSNTARTHSRPSSPPRRSRMPSIFNIVRASVYGAVVLFTVICLAMAGHFQHVLAASDLTRFVPFSVFVCSASLFIFFVLLGLSLLLKERNPVNTRMELTSLGIAGIFWLVLGVFLVTSDSQSADVECFSSASATQPLDDSVASFHTEQYQAMYRVLMVFSLFNAVLVVLFCLTLLFLAIRKHKSGENHMWYGPVTSCAWFNRYNTSNVKRGDSKSSSILPLTLGTESGSRKRSQGRNHGRSPYANGRPSGRSDSYEKALPSRPPVRQYSGNSGRSTLIGSHSTNDFERGNMLNPNLPTPARHR
ncbi:hypothetical protein H2248_006326 [Termitomyces sp. 'cryptogamus']|nr:hypothetical protein H2248_006326 [Termitomyces sp. 'cryptogamus']